MDATTPLFSSSLDASKNLGLAIDRNRMPPPPPRNTNAVLVRERPPNATQQHMAVKEQAPQKQKGPAQVPPARQHGDPSARPGPATALCIAVGVGVLGFLCLGEAPSCLEGPHTGLQPSQRTAKEHLKGEEGRVSAIEQKTRWMRVNGLQK